MGFLETIQNWSNQNSGFLALILFTTTLLLGWVTGIFKALMKNPKFEINVIDGPSICSSFDTGRTINNQGTHRTAVAVYLRVKNVGTAPAEIEKVSVAYKSHAYMLPFRWFWIKNETVCLADFTGSFGEDKKVIPFMHQKNQLIENKTSSYLNIGESRIGLCYFEQGESVGKYFPKDKNFFVKIRVRVTDSFGKNYYCNYKIPKLTLRAAQELCPKFGYTNEQLLQKSS
jgi:hypothetical protein